VAAAPAYLAAKQKLGDYEKRWDRFLVAGVPILGVVLMMIAVLCLALGLMRRAPKGLPVHTAAAVSAALMVGCFGFWFADQLQRHPTRGTMAMKTAPPDDGQRVMMMKGKDKDKADERGARNHAVEDVALGVPGGGRGDFPVPAPVPPMVPGGLLK